VRGTATLTFLDRDGTRAAERTLAESVHAVAFSPKGTRIGLCTRAAIALFDRSGDELARGTGGQESLLACAFADDDRLLAVGRDVNSGPALLELALLEKA